MRKAMLVLVAAVVAALLSSSPSQASGCYTPQVGGFNTVQVCVLEGPLR